VCVLGFEYPALWSIGILTKVTPGVSLLWFVVRREWRALAWALGATAAIRPSRSSSRPSAWFDWAKFLTTSQDTGAGSNDWYDSYLPAAVAADRDHRRGCWSSGALAPTAAGSCPVATAIAMPVIWITTPAILVAIPRPRLRRKAGRTGCRGVVDAQWR
jgi:hypothetical protein